MQTSFVDCHAIAAECNGGSVHSHIVDFRFQHHRRILAHHAVLSTQQLCIFHLHVELKERQQFHIKQQVFCRNHGVALLVEHQHSINTQIKRKLQQYSFNTHVPAGGFAHLLACNVFRIVLNEWNIKQHRQKHEHQNHCTQHFCKCFYDSIEFQLFHARNVTKLFRDLSFQSLAIFVTIKVSKI